MNTNIQEDFRIYISVRYRSSHRSCSVKKGVLRNFAKLTGKHFCKSIFLMKLQASLWCLKRFYEGLKGTLAQVFFCEFCELSQNTFSTEHLGTTISGDDDFL